ncbi:MAG TPA: phosphotransferase family protein [Terriglobales bacterium]|nr:phosphotransferase family protein [Terriglobales bacterium]
MMDYQDKPASVRPGEELELVKLEPFLRRHFPDLAGPLSVAQFPSGHSNLTYSVQLGGRQLVLRRPPFGSKVKSAHDMGREFRVLSKLHAIYPLAPKVLLYCDDDSVLGLPFYLLEPFSGVILRRDPPAGLPFTQETASRLCETFVDQLARLHSIDYSAAGLAELGKPQGYLERQVRGWIERYHGSKTDEIPDVERISQWLQHHLPVSSETSLIHNDYKLDNLVLDATDLTKIIGVLDWEMCTIGDPLSDLGTTLAYWVDAADPEDLQKLRWGPTNYPGSLTRGELLNRYAQITRRDVSNMDFYLVFARFKLAVIVQQIYYRYRQGLTKDPRFAGMAEAVQALLRASWHVAQSGRI